MTIYTNTARFDTGRPLTEDELRKLAPSVFATEAHVSRSARFKPIPTIEAVRALAKEGFMVFGAKQATARQEGRADYTKHLLRIRHINDASKLVGDTVLEMLLKNANDGTSAYDLISGLYRVICRNSLVSQVGTVESTKVRHSGDVARKVVEGTFSVIETAKMALAAPDQWSQIKLNRDEAQVLANGAHLLRFADAEGNVTTPVKAEALLEPQRAQDNVNDLWTTFNVLQENCIRGGIRAVGTNAAGQRRRMTTRAVKGIDQDVKLNRALFLIADQMAALKGAKPIAA